MPVSQTTVAAPPTPAQAAPPVAEGERGTPALAATTENWQRPKFGNMVAGEITNTRELKDEFKKSVQVIAEQLRSYARTPGAELTAEQIRFLELYKKDGTGEDMLKTESGAVVAHLMAENEVFLRLAALKKQVEFVRHGHGDPNKLKNEFTVAELQGLVNKHGKEFLAVVGGALGISTDILLALTNPTGAIVAGVTGVTLAGGVGITAVIKSALTTGRFKISDLIGVDTSRLPDKYQKYVDYIAGSVVAQQGVNEYIFNESIKTLKFYKALGVDSKHLNYLTPWQRLNMGVAAPVAAGISADVASQNVLTDWMIFRRNALESYGAIAAGDIPAEKARKYFDAQLATIQHFIGNEIGRIRGEQRTSTGISLTQMKAVRDKMKSPAGLTEKKAKKQKELDEATRSLETKKVELKTAKERVKALNKESAEYAIRAPNLVAKLSEIAHPTTGAIAKLTAEIGTWNTRRTTEAGAFDAQYTAVPGGPNQASTKAEIRSQKAEALKPIDEEIERRIKRIEELKKIQEVLEKQMEDEVTRGAELIGLTADITTLDTDIKALEKTKIPKLEKEVKSGLNPKEQKQLNQLEAAVRGLERYDTVFSDLANFDTKDLKVNQLLSITPEDEGGITYQSGYLKALKLIFNYEHPPEGITVKDFFEAVKTRLPQAKLAEILVQFFDIPAGPPYQFTHPGALAPTIYPNALDYTMDYIQVMEGPSPNTFNQVFFPVMDNIEHEGLRFK